MSFCSHCQKDVETVTAAKVPSAFKQNAERLVNLCAPCNHDLEKVGALPLLPYEKPFRYSSEGRTPRCPTLDEQEQGIRRLSPGPIVVG